MDQPDFNGSFDGFRERSKAYAAAVKEFKADAGYKDSAGSPAEIRALDACFEVVFESAAIFGVLVPAQANLLLRELPAEQIHRLHSSASRRELKAAGAKSSEVPQSIFRFGSMLARQILSRPHVASVLDAEVKERLLASEAPPPAIKRRAPRA